MADLPGHDKSRRPGDKRKGFTETDYARFCARLGYVASGGWRPVSPVAGGWGAVMAGRIIITARQAS